MPYYFDTDGARGWHDPNPGRAIPLGGRAYPLNAAGTQLGAAGLILSGDDAPKFRAAGFSVAQFYVQCSAKIVSGEDTFRRGGFGAAYTGQVAVAVDCNGEPGETVAVIADLQDARPATGIYHGTTSRSVVGYIDARNIGAAHAALKRHLPGFECFAVLS